MDQPRPGEAGGSLVSRAARLPAPAPDPRAVLSEATGPRTVWDPPDGATVVAGGAAAVVDADGPDRFATIRERADRLLAAGDVHAGTEAACPRLFGGFAFHEGARDREPWTAFPAARFVLPRVQVTYDGESAWLTVNAVGEAADGDVVESRLRAERERVAALPDPGDLAPAPGIDARTRTTSRENWRRGVDAAVDRIRAGDLRKVVLAQALEANLAAQLSVPDVLARLDDRYPDCHRFLIEPGPDAGAGGPAPGGTRRTDRPAFFGATPERLVSLRGRTVRTGALAGTTGRGETPAEDEWLAEELLADAKNSHEHDLVAETVREQLAPVAASVSAGERRVRRLATVQHLFTPITAELSADTHVLDLAEALHPTPAVGGLPPGRALDTIRETEPFDRGWYAAPVGWIDAAGNGSFAVAIRSAVAAADRRHATLFAGVGIVADSDPDREWDEIQLKYRPILDELEGT